MGVQFQIIFLGFVQYSIKDIYLIIEKKKIAAILLNI